MIAFVDVESSGLNERAGHLFEVALVVTDDDLVERAAVDVVVQPVGVAVDKIEMDPVVVSMHEKNGLLAELRAGAGMRRFEAEDLLVAFVKAAFAGVPDVEIDKCKVCDKRREEHDVASIEAKGTVPVCRTALCPPPPPGYAPIVYTFSPKTVSALSQTPLAGSTVGFDRRWLREHMPKLEALFSYRSIDVSSLTELAKRWAPEVYAGRPKAGAAHRALADVRESIAYLKYFRDAGFVGGARGV